MDLQEELDSLKIVESIESLYGSAILNDPNKVLGTEAEAKKEKIQGRISAIEEVRVKRDDHLKTIVHLGINLRGLESFVVCIDHPRFVRALLLIFNS